jgi:hypothetical protein
MTYAKTALAAQALKQRDVALMSQRQRAALILFDGKRSVNEVLRQTAGLGVQPEDITQLVNIGLLSSDAPPPADGAPTDFAPSTLSPPSALPNGDLPPDEQQRRYREAYPLATQLTAALGLRGFRLNLAVERADGYPGLLRLLPQIEAATGAETAAGLRAALEGVARH